MVKKIFCGLILSSALIAGCLKNDAKCPYSDSHIIAPGDEIDSLREVLTDSGIVATPHASGLFYKTSTSGTGTGIANLCSNLTVTFEGRLFNGAVFDSTTAGSVAKFQLGQVIPGWREGLPLISKGGNITLYVPPSLAYGPNPVKDSQGNVLIPGNSYLVFDIKLMDIQ